MQTSILGRITVSSDTGLNFTVTLTHEFIFQFVAHRILVHLLYTLNHPQNADLVERSKGTIKIG